MKGIIISILIVVGLISLAIFLSPKDKTITGSANNVEIVNGQQIINLGARGGYQPRISTAKAGLPTVLRFSTKNTFDCSASVRIPSLNISKLLPLSGTTDIDIGVQPAGIFRGSCGMGMYPFEINFVI